MDKNKFWLGGRLFNTASPRLGTPTQHKARPQVGRPNANARHVRKLGAPTHVRNANARHVRKLGAPTHVRNANARHVRKLGVPTHVRNANARHVRKLGAPTQRKARPQDGHPNAKLIRNENIHTREH
jgi:hypothetical protein